MRSSSRDEPIGIVGWSEGERSAVPLRGDRRLAAHGLARAGAWARTPCARSRAGCSTERGHRRVTIDPAADQRARDPLLRARRLPARRRDAPLRAPSRAANRATSWVWTCFRRFDADRERRRPAAMGPRRRASLAFGCDAVDRRAPTPTGDPGTGLGGNWRVIVLNDDHNTFDHVAHTLARTSRACPSTRATRSPT